MLQERRLAPVVQKSPASHANFVIRDGQSVMRGRNSAALLPQRFTQDASRMTSQGNAAGLSAVALAKAGGFFQHSLLTFP